MGFIKFINRKTAEPSIFGAEKWQADAKASFNDNGSH